MSVYARGSEEWVLLLGKEGEEMEGAGLDRAEH